MIRSCNKSDHTLQQLVWIIDYRFLWVIIPKSSGNNSLILQPNYYVHRKLQLTLSFPISRIFRLSKDIPSPRQYLLGYVLKQIMNISLSGLIVSHKINFRLSDRKSNKTVREQINMKQTKLSLQKCNLIHYRSKAGSPHSIGGFSYS